MMNIFHKVTLQSMKKSRTRTIVTVIGVILSAAMITAVTTFSVSLLNYMIKGATVKYGGWHVEFLDVDSSFGEARARDAGVAGTAISENIGYAELKGGKNPNKPYLFIAGFSKEAFDTVPIELVSGRLPENSGEITFQLGDAYELVSYDRIQVTVTEKGPSADSTAASTDESQEGTESETSEGPASTSKAEPGQ